MNQAELEKDLVALLRQRALSDSDRQIDLEEPIGEMGIGLDSLAMVEFMVQIEKRYYVEIPHTIWFTKEELSLADIVKMIQELGRNDASADQIVIDHAASVREKLLQQPGRAPRSILKRAIVRLLRPIYERKSCVILCHDLTGVVLPQYNAGIELIYRAARFDDFVEHYRKNPLPGQERTLQIYSDRFTKGYICLIAESNGLIVARDWLSPDGDYEQGLNLNIRMKPGSIYGLDLIEHPGYRGKGVGLSLLSYALTETKRLGFSRQYTMVRMSNERMLVAAIQMFGFRNVGTVRTTRFLRWVRSSWAMGERNGAGEIIL